MNSLYKFYCRTFQTAVRLAIPLLPYRDPEILGSVSDVPSKLAEKGIDSVLIVTDGVINKLSVMDTLKRALTDGNIRYAVYAGTVPNPTVENVEEARRVYLRNKCDAIIGFGGGSAIDCAKAVGARIARPGKTVPQMEGVMKVVLGTPFFVAIPTTSGTGSEVTLTTVITDGKSGHKFTVNDFALIPDVAVLDAENMKTMPPSVTSATGMDALTHAVEAYIGRSTTRSTRSDAMEAVWLIFGNIEKAYLDGNDTEARENMMKASFLAGRAFSRSYVGYVHAVAHSLGGRYNIPHGLANAVFLPILLEAYGENVHKKLHELAVAAGISDECESDEEGALKFISAVKDMNGRMNIPKKLTGIKDEDIELMAEYAAKEANPMYPVPVIMDKKTIEQFYYRVADRSENEHED